MLTTKNLSKIIGTKNLRTMYFQIQKTEFKNLVYQIILENGQQFKGHFSLMR